MKSNITITTNPIQAHHRKLHLPKNHPSSHGILEIKIELNGTTIISAEPILGHMHRGVEKLCEFRTYQQCISLLERHDWSSNGNGSHAFVLLIEQAMGIASPPRAQWIRTQVAEMGKLSSHLLFLSYFPFHHTSKQKEVRSVLLTLREKILHFFEKHLGARIHPSYFSIGGISHDISSTWQNDISTIFNNTSPMIFDAQKDISSFAQLGILSTKDAAAAGASGIVSKASSINNDARIHNPYDAYNLLQEHLKNNTRTEGDVAARCDVLWSEIYQSINIIQVCNENIPAGDYKVKLPKTISLPEGEYYSETETGLGLNGYWIVSEGKTHPYRVKIRSASFPHAFLLSKILPENDINNIESILSSLFLLSGDFNR